MRTLRRRRRDLVCRQLVEKVTAYLEGDLRPRDRAAVDRHLALCGHCDGYVQQVRRMLELTVPGTDEPLPEGLLDALALRYRESR